MKKVPTKEFQTFKKECARLQKTWGLLGWDLDFAFLPLDKKAAQTRANLVSRKATITLASELDEESYLSRDSVKSARHEMIHLLLWRMSMYGYSRFVTNDDLEEGEHELIMQLLKILRF